MNARRLLQCALWILLGGLALHAQAWIRSPAVAFGEMPPGTAYPEGITADAQGNIYVADFDIGKPLTDHGNVVVFGRNGKVLRTLTVANSSPRLLGLAFKPGSGDLLVLDIGAGALLQVDPATGASSTLSTFPAGAGPNGLTFDPAGNIYVSDSFLATIWKIAPGGGAPVAWATHPTLGTAGVPPFGANGIAFNSAHTAMFVANTGDDTVVRIPVLPGFVAGTPEVFVNSVNGADGLVIDGADNIWIAANQSDEIVILDPSGKVIAKLGDFDGLDPRGAPAGLLFPASLVFSDGFVYVTNLGLDLRGFGFATIDSQWAAAARHFTIARIRAHIPPVR
jgi:sugar lactone lactonase YvrE